MPSDNVLERKIQKFLKSRRSNETKDQIEAIVAFLVRERETRKTGWVPVKEIIEAFFPHYIRNQTTVYRMLGDLTEAEIIDKKEEIAQKGPGRKPTYYRVPISYPQEWFWSREGLSLNFQKALLRLGLAQYLLMEYHKDDTTPYSPDNDIENYGRKRSKIYDDLMRAETESEFEKIRSANIEEYKKLSRP
jgi:hypothetical protein